MYLNGYYIDFVDKWDKKPDTTGITDRTSSNYFKPKGGDGIEAPITHKITAIVQDKHTAEALGEMFENPHYTIALIQDSSIPQFDGVYNLDKGNISLDGGLTHWEVKLWLSNRKNSIRYSQHQENIQDDEFEYIVAETSDYTDLPNGTGTAANDGADGFYANTSYEFGYPYWNSFVAEMDVEVAGLTIYYPVWWKAGEKYLRFGMDASTSTLYVETYDVYTGGTRVVRSISKTYTAGTYYTIKIIASGGRYDFVFDGEHFATVYYRDVTASTHRLYMSSTTARVKNYSLKRYVPIVHTVPTYEENYEHPSPQSYTYTREGLLRRYVNTAEEITTEVYPSRVLTGEVKVWDTMGNDFSLTGVPPMPLYWKRVYSEGHKFVGNLYIENGIYGILYTDAGLYHYVYDKPHRRGQIAWLDFKQNPSYEVWNESYQYRAFRSKDSGAPMWDENGLNFKGEATDGDKDVVINDNKIIGIDGTSGAIHNMYGYRVDVKFTPTEVSSHTLHFISGVTWDGSYKTLHLQWDSANERLDLQIENSDVVNASWIYNGVTSGNTYTISIIFPVDQDGMMLYVDGELVHKEDETVLSVNRYAYTYDNTSKKGYYTVGNAGAFSSYDESYNGNIEYSHYRMAGQGKAILRQMKAPLMWHSFDEIDWDNGSSSFLDKGSSGVGLSVTNDPKFIKAGRYNQCMHLNGTDVTLQNLGITTELDTLPTAFTLETWIKFIGTPADSQNIIRIGRWTGLSDITAVLYQNATSIYLGIWDTTSASFKQTGYAHTSHTMDTDGKWHHIAGTWDGTDLILYIDGVAVSTLTDATMTPQTLPAEIYIGYDTALTGTTWVNLEMYIDEVIISDYAKQPHEFGVMIPDIYDTGQWYPKSDFEQLSDGTWREKSEHKTTTCMLGIEESTTSVTVSNAITGNTGGSYNSYKGMSVTQGKVGLGMRNAQDTGGKTIYLGHSVEQDFTWQWYNFSDTAPDATVHSVNLITSWTAKGTSRQLQFWWYNNLTVGISATGYSFDDVVSTVDTVSLDTWHHNVVTYNASTYQLTWYIDGSIFYQVTVRGGLFDAEPKEAQAMQFFQNYGRNVGTVSNFSAHEGILTTAEQGLFCDTRTEIPILYGTYSSYASLTGANQSTFTRGYTLREVTPDYVVVDIYAPNPEILDAVIPTRMESGSYFFQFDKSNPVATSTNYNGIVFLPPDQSKMARFMYNVDNDGAGADVLYDMGLTEGSIFANAISAEHVFYFGYERANLVMVAIRGTLDPTGGDVYMEGGSGDNRINRTIVGTEGWLSFGFVPQRAVNDVFWDATEGTVAGATYSALGSGWYLGSAQAGSYSKGGDYQLWANNQRWGRGVYAIIGRGYVTASVWANGIYNRTEAHYVPTLTNHINTSIENKSDYVNCTDIEEFKELELYNFRNTSSAGTMYFDYLVAFPLTNGIDFPLDLALQHSATRRYKERIVE